ncbi:hypothetical protein PLICRDRAFT_125236 [Plicaturopsis crispa FD-325 SS-3]|nr:hypothetical protein PLICRDRAFT_125236 [Plicaturopsis crispa FD-325 SS-3]
MEKVLQALRPSGQLVYTPMINAKMFFERNRKNFREQNFNIAEGEEGGPEDRPLIVQFCANDPEQLLASAKVVEPHCDAVDINLGCPQDIAKKGYYGCFLQEDWELIYTLINTLHNNLSIPVTAKFRVFPTVEKTVEYAQMLERAGAKIITCHGRTREQRGHTSGLADWAKIRAVKDAVSIPVFANGNILYHSDIEECLIATGADAVMSAEGQLYNPALFAPSTHPHTPPTASSSTSLPPGSSLTGLHPPHADLALEYLSVVRSQRTRTAMSAVKGHLFKIMRPGLARETDLREQLGRVKVTPAFEAYVAIATELKARMDRDRAAAMAGGTSVDELIRIDEATGLKVLPHWLAQPYFRPLAPDTLKDRRAESAAIIETTDRGCREAPALRVYS